MVFVKIQKKGPIFVVEILSGCYKMPFDPPDLDTVTTHSVHR
jgi:hypothetical protein